MADKKTGVGTAERMFEKTSNADTVMNASSQHGRVAIVTGASSGLGEAVARALASSAMRVILAVRNLPKGLQRAATMPGLTEVRELDLTRIDSIHRFVRATPESIDLLVNNAGVMGLPPTTTEAGLEAQAATNHLGPFALSLLLLPRIRDRIITVSSLMHWQARLNLDWHMRTGYNGAAAYAASKLANLLFTYELHRRLEAAGSAVRSIAKHPGIVRTHLFDRAERTPRMILSRWLVQRLGRESSVGAGPIIWAATANVRRASKHTTRKTCKSPIAPALTLPGRTRGARNHSARRPYISVWNDAGHPAQPKTRRKPPGLRSIQIVGASPCPE